MRIRLLVGIFAAAVSASGGAPLAPGAKAEPPADGTLRFSGYEWRVKSGRTPLGPGPNLFSAANATVDRQGRLHLKITRDEAGWHCAEVITKRSLGYGTYRFVLDSAAGDLDPNVVLGLFTWSDTPDYAHREIDCELSRWGDPENLNAQFVLQPGGRGQHVRFEIPPGLRQSTHQLTWTPGLITCLSLKGHPKSKAPAGSVLCRHTFSEGVPPAGDENARINLWLMGGKPPTDGKEAEVILSRFEFLPARTQPAPRTRKLPGDPAIRVTQAPPPRGKTGGWGQLRGTVSGVDPGTHRVVVYNHTDRYYVQPLTNDYEAQIAPDGSWQAATRRGDRYGVLLVRAGYRAAPELDMLPGASAEVPAVVEVAARQEGRPPAPARDGRQPSSGEAFARQASRVHQTSTAQMLRPYANLSL